MADTPEKKVTAQPLPAPPQPVSSSPVTPEAERLADLAELAGEREGFVEVSAAEFAWLVQRSRTQRRGLQLAADDARRRVAAVMAATADGDEPVLPRINALAPLLREMLAQVRS